MKHKGAFGGRAKCPVRFGKKLPRIAQHQRNTVGPLKPKTGPTEDQQELTQVVFNKQLNNNFPIRPHGRNLDSSPTGGAF